MGYSNYIPPAPTVAPALISPLVLTDPADVGSLLLSYFGTIPGSPNSGYGVVHSTHPDSGLFVDDGGNVVLASGATGAYTLQLDTTGQFTLTCGNLATFDADMGFHFESSGGGFLAEIGTGKHFTFSGGDFNIDGTDIKFNGVSILGGGGGGGFTPSGLAVQFLMGDGSYNSNDYLAINPAFISMVSDFLTLHPPFGGSTITFDQASGVTRMASDNAGVLWFDSSAGGFSIQSADGSSEINSNTSKAQLRRNGYGEVTIGAGTVAIYGQNGGIDIDALGNVSINNGFTGTGAYTNFTIVGGVITAAS